MQHPPSRRAADSPNPPSPGYPGYDEEVASRLTLLDFYHAWYGYRFWFIAGFLIVAVGAFVWTKFFMPKFYRSEVRFFVGEKFTPESMIGLADIKLFTGSRNDQYQAVVHSNLAEQYLLSSDLITTVTWQLKHTPEEGQPPLDICQLLGIEEQDALVREAKLVKLMRENLLQVRLSGTTGIVIYQVEMPTPMAAARYANASVRQLQRQMTQQAFSYWDEARRLYDQELERVMAERRELALRLDRLPPYDRYGPIEQERKALKEQLDVQAEQIALIRSQVELLRLATEPTAKAAAQPVKVIDWGDPPIKKSRPKTILTTILAAGLYSFVFMLGLVIAGFFTAQARRA
ncbi:MAG TPA: hypothetical protein PK847_04810 [Candidatus Sumerlaeota bacterium]|nr:hypothetical protein [Candidatus Sumerlaeota bacterium]